MFVNFSMHKLLIIFFGTIVWINIAICQHNCGMNNDNNQYRSCEIRLCLLNFVIKYVIDSSFVLIDTLLSSTENNLPLILFSS